MISFYVFKVAEKLVFFEELYKLNYDFKIVNKKEITQLKNIHNSLFISQKKNSYFLCQSFNHYLNDCIILGAFDKKKMIGSFGLQKKYDKEIKSAYMAHWPVVKKKYQSTGIFKVLASKLLNSKDIDFIYQFFPVRSFDSFKKIIGLNSKTITEFEISTEIYGFYPNSINFKISKNFKQLSSHHSLKKQYKSFDYNYAYRKWRYVDHPIYEYLIFYVTRSEFIIFKVFEDTSIFIDVMEISINLGQIERNKNIIISFMNYIKEKYKNSIINLWSLEDIQFNKMLLSIGYKKIKSKHIFGYKFFKDRIINHQWLVQKNDSQKY